jgi:hypothetical protein
LDRLCVVAKARGFRIDVDLATGKCALVPIAANDNREQEDEPQWKA